VQNERAAETLKWGQPSYLTPETGSGTTIRLDAVRDAPGSFGIYFHCQSGLIERFREVYGKRFHYQGNRALMFSAREILPENELRICLLEALTYHLGKKKKSATRRDIERL